MKVIFNNFKKRYSKNKTKLDQAFRRVMESGWLILGNEVKKFEKDFSSYIGTKETIGVANGLEAIQIALMALGIKAGDEVITTPLTAAATSLAIISVGATPVFVDIDEYFHLDGTQIETSITPKTRAIIPVHLYGQPVNIEGIIEIAEKYKLHVIEDCAQAHGASYKNKKVGSFGTFGCFSFYPTKNLGGFGDGGAITTNDSELAEKCRTLRNYGQKNRYEHESYGINSRLDELQAAFLNELLPSLDEENKKRNELAEKYNTELANLKSIKLPLVRSEVEHAYHLYVIETDQRDKLQEFLKDYEIETLIHYPKSINKQTVFKPYSKVILPKVEDKTKKILSLPIHPDLAEEEIAWVCEKIKEFDKQLT